MLQLREQTKRCSKCGAEKELTEFSPNPTGRLGVHSRCKPCRANTQAEYFDSHREKYRDYARANGKRHYARNRSTIEVAKAGASCVDCGVEPEDPTQLHFHHLDPSSKRFSIGVTTGHSPETLQAEMAKCVLLCDGCHRARHYKSKEEAR